jgi:hypothetical protein
MAEAGFGAEDFGSGGVFRGRLVVSTARCVVGKPDRGKTEPTCAVVVKGRDVAGNKQELWLSLGGDAKSARQKFKPTSDGKNVDCRTDDKPNKTSKYGIFMASLRKDKFTIGKEAFDGVGFPMSRLAEMKLAALDGCTLEVDNRPMDVGPTILQDIQRKGKSHPTAYIVTGFSLPGEAQAEEPDDPDEDPEEGEDDPDEDGAAAKLETAIRTALTKAAKPVELKLLRTHIAKKFADDDDVDEMITLLTAPAIWTTAADWSGVVIDKKAKTLSLED